jgi:hypothetical protein
MQRDWAVLGPKLRGKLHVMAGLSDNFFLNDAVYRSGEFLSTASPPADDAELLYGARDEHRWSGDASTFNAVSRLGFTGRLLPRKADWRARTAPPRARACPGGGCGGAEEAGPSVPPAEEGQVDRPGHRLVSRVVGVQAVPAVVGRQEA